MLESQLAHITNVARHIGARYWVVVDGDLYLEFGLPPIHKRVSQLESVLPVVFRSRTGKTQICDRSCLHQPEQPECQAAVPVLFPAGR